MKNFETIYNEIVTTKKTHTEEEKATEMVKTFFSLPIDDRLEYHKKIDKQSIKVKEELQHNNIIDIKLNLLYNNAKASLFAEILPSVVQVWNKYINKKLGTKTLAKLNQELNEINKNCQIYFNNRDGFEVVALTEKGYPNTNCKFTFATHNINIIDEDNKATAITSDIFNIVFEKIEYIDDIDTQINKILTAFAEYQQKAEELNKSISNFNSLIYGNIDNIHPYYADKGIG